MGFMDKAKKLAEQAQEKLGEAQKNFNQSGSPQSQPEEGGGVRYDEHGRPIQEAPPAGATAPPAAEPAPPAPTSPPVSEEPAPDPAAPPPAADKPASDTNKSPDPFKPLGQ